MNDE
ncbi:hypothetical protein VCPCS023_001015A, partial [Vibrio cholerae O1 str. PCS-023]|jgi:hypothetical protein